MTHMFIPTTPPTSTLRRGPRKVQAHRRPLPIVISYAVASGEADLPSLAVCLGFLSTRSCPLPIVISYAVASGEADLPNQARCPGFLSTRSCPRHNPVAYAMGAAKHRSDL